MKRARFAALAAALGLAAAVFPAASAAAPREVLPWMEDFAKAAERARARNLPLFVEAWAPW